MWLDDRGTSWPKGSDSVWFPLCSVGSHVLMLRSFENLSCISISPRSEGGGDLFFFSFFLLFITHHVQIIVPVSCILLCMAWRWQIWGIRLHIPIKQPQKVYCQSSCKSQDLSQRPGNEALACRQRRVWGRAYERKNDRDEMLMGRYGAAAEVSYADRKKKSVFAVRLRGGIDLLSFWLTFFFSGSPAVYRFSPTHIHSQGLAPYLFFIFFCSSLFLSHTVPDQSLPRSSTLWPP